MKITLPPRLPRPLLTLVPVGLLFLSIDTAASASTSGLGGGARAAAQVGALTGRADDLGAAMTFNPAGLTELSGLELAIGGVHKTTDATYQAVQGPAFATDSDQTQPVLYLGWRPDRASSRFALGLAYDTAAASELGWSDPDFPGATSGRRYDVDLQSLRASVAYRLSDSWSLALTGHFVSGELRDDNRVLLLAGRNPGSFFVFGERSGVADDVDGVGAGLAVQYRAGSWGFGATATSEIETDGPSTNTVIPTDPPEELILEILGLIDPFRENPRELHYALPATLSVGVWRQLRETVSVELDAVFANWSETGNRLERPLVGCPECEPFDIVDPDDTLSLRAAVEWRPNDSWSLHGGIAHEPSPFASEVVVPVLPEGDALVLGLGLTRRFDRFAVDLAYSRREHDPERPEFGPELEVSSDLAAVTFSWGR